MPSYRLLAGDRTVLETFAAEHDGEAIERGRRLRWISGLSRGRSSPAGATSG
jgi:hypothetical protein